MRFDVTGCAVPGGMTLYTLVTIMPVLLKSGKIMDIGPICLLRATEQLPISHLFIQSTVLSNTSVFYVDKSSERRILWDAHTLVILQ